MLQLNAIKSYAKDKTMRLPKYFATFSIVFKVIDVFYQHLYLLIENGGKNFLIKGNYYLIKHISIS